MGQNSVSLPWFDSRGNPMFKPHDENVRVQKVVLNEYVYNVLNYGVVMGVRGDPWGLLTENPPYPMLTWGHDDQSCV